MSTTIPQFNPPQIVVDFFTAKLRRAIRAAEDQTLNPARLEAPWYEVYNLWIEILLLSNRRFGSCPQAWLRAYVDDDMKKIPDFLINKYIDTVPPGVIVTTPRIIVEVKRPLPGNPSPTYILRTFRLPEYITQIRNQAKFAFASHQHVTRIFLIQAVGKHWRRGVIFRATTSPYSDQPAPLGANNNISWGPISELLTANSDARVQIYLNNMPGNAFAH
jgi:hypothetical protein